MKTLKKVSVFLVVLFAVTLLKSFTDRHIIGYVPEGQVIYLPTKGHNIPTELSNYACLDGLLEEYDVWGVGGLATDSNYAPVPCVLVGE